MQELNVYNGFFYPNADDWTPIDGGYIEVAGIHPLVPGEVLLIGERPIGLHDADEEGDLIRNNCRFPCRLVQVNKVTLNNDGDDQYTELYFTRG